MFALLAQLAEQLTLNRLATDRALHRYVLKPDFGVFCKPLTAFITTVVCHTIALGYSACMALQRLEQSVKSFKHRLELSFVIYPTIYCLRVHGTANLFG